MMMATQQIEQVMVGGRRMIGIGIALVGLLALLLAARLTLPAPASQAVFPAAAQPAVGRSSVVTGLVFDGTRYISAPIAIGAQLEQPVVGRAITVMGLVFDGTRYMNAPIAVGAPRAERGYAVTALVYDGATYRGAPVQVRGR
jgi:hypothetical protein